MRRLPRRLGRARSEQSRERAGAGIERLKRRTTTVDRHRRRCRCFAECCQCASARFYAGACVQPNSGDAHGEAAQLHPIIRARARMRLLIVLRLSLLAADVVARERPDCETQQQAAPARPASQNASRVRERRDGRGRRPPRMATTAVCRRPKPGSISAKQQSGGDWAFWDECACDFLRDAEGRVSIPMHGDDFVKVAHTIKTGTSATARPLLCPFPGFAHVTRREHHRSRQ